MKQSKGRKFTALNTLGSLGYVACLLQWLWMIMILLPSILASPFFKFLTTSDTSVVAPPVVESGGAAASVPVFVPVIAMVIGVLIVIGMVYVVVVKFPRSVAKTGEKVTHTVAEVISPVVIQHIHLPTKQQRQLPELLIVIMKLLLVFAPLCLLLSAQGLSLAMSFELIMVIGIMLFSWSFVLFALQFMFSKLLKVDYKTVR